MAVLWLLVSNSSMCPRLLHGTQHRAGAHKHNESPVNSLSQECPSAENFFNGVKVMFLPFILSLTFSGLLCADGALAGLHYNC